MISFVVYAVEIIICFLLQSTVFTHLNIGGIVPNLVILVIVAAAYQKGKYYGMFLGVLGGVLLDIQFGELLGVYALGYLFIGYFCGFMNRFYIKHDTLLPLSMICLSEFVFSFYCYFCIMLTKGRLDFFFYLRRIIIPNMCYTVVVGLIVYKFIDFIYNSALVPVTQEEN